MRWALVLPLCFISTVAWSQSPDAGANLGRKGPYLGVQPGTQDVAPNTKDARSKGAIRRVTWVGFQMRGQGGRVFIQSTEPAAYDIAPSPPNQIIVNLPNSRLNTRNDRRPLDTGWFPTAVSSVRAVQRKNNVTEVTISLRQVVGYDLRQEGNYIFLDFRPPVGQLTAPAKSVVPNDGASPKP
ncbi:MAG: AMIN domain-containing protein [Myxococcota bacterium]|nr:AMIN domain-containing protein [Myxococcota bacterium]